MSDLRRAHGWEEPHGVKFWCLGNEMDGPWQAGAKTAEEYGRVAAETAKVMRWVDPTIELAACGSSGRHMPSFGEWERIVLEHCFEQVEWISLHTYFNNYAEDTLAFLASPDLMDRFIEEVVAIADSVAARRRSARRIMLSFDEWNVWYRTRRPREKRVKPGWPVAPAILEEVYTIEDALVVGGACISLLNHADRVRAACLAQLVNVIAPIMTETGGLAWRQTIFFPFAHVSRYGRGEVLRPIIQCETYSAIYNDPYGDADHLVRLPAVPYLKLAAVATAEGASVFALNRHLVDPLVLEITLGGFPEMWMDAALTLHDADLTARNTADAPERVKPVALESVSLNGEKLRAELPPASWSMLRLTTAGRKA